MNNAGRSQRALFEKTSFEVDRQLLEINTLGTISLTKALLPHMIKQKSGHIVVTSSLAGKHGEYINRRTLYYGINSTVSSVYLNKLLITRLWGFLWWSLWVKLLSIA